ncbi:DUF732 domain-containing protein [Nocardia paucivorans]|uniref:DUF732 domain-containing protein n=1 Tax=Nocardia paucivorans TaxID=114259 RepID=UPI0002E7F7FA|nr:DUF732 domain-containing protein [Nocardia paucivorans]
MFRVFVIGTLTTALMYGAALTAHAAPGPGARSPEVDTAIPENVVNPNPADDAVAQRPWIDRKFLRAALFDDEPYAVQDAAIRLARAQCAYLDTVGNTPRNHLYLAEGSREFVHYPYLFLNAAIDSYCPHNRL